MLNIKQIEGLISKIPFVNKILSIKEDGLFINGEIEIKFECLEKPLNFKFQISPQYPLKSYESESIKFINKDLLEYQHVMEDGSICIHTSYNKDIRKKLLIDFNSLKYWIKKYYINNDKDLKYEHIIVNPSPVNDIYYSYIFVEVDYEFKKNDFGEVKISFLSEGLFKGKRVRNYIVQSFITPSKEIIECSWNSSYKNMSSTNGFYIFTESTPAKYNKFAFMEIAELENSISQDFIQLLYTYQKNNLKKNINEIVPIFIGYKTVETEIHWQVALFEMGQFPIQEDYEKEKGVYIPIIKLTNQNIHWAKTYNASYKYFFGRGIFSSQITEFRILIIGIGALGSMIAKTLVKGGCKFVDIADFDIKEPENVCRSEYLFNTGITDKANELKQILSDNSPFVEVRSFPNELFDTIIKSFYTNLRGKNDFTATLNKYDIIFDCTTDNDLMYVLNSLDIECDLINLSMTNHAKDLVCAFYPNVYHFVNTQFSELLDNDISDLYEPTGCWSPTFKASYNDIAILVQMALKQINLIYEGILRKNSFVIKTNTDDIFSARIETY